MSHSSSSSSVAVSSWRPAEDQLQFLVIICCGRQRSIRIPHTHFRVKVSTFWIIFSFRGKRCYVPSPSLCSYLRGLSDPRGTTGCSRTTMSMPSLAQCPHPTRNGGRLQREDARHTYFPPFCAVCIAIFFALYKEIVAVLITCRNKLM